MNQIHVFSIVQTCSASISCTACQRTKSHVLYLFCLNFHWQSPACQAVCQAVLAEVLVQPWGGVAQTR